MKHIDIARICHESNRAYCEAIGDSTQKPWDLAEEWQKESAIKGVDFAVKNPNLPDSSQHDSWLADKEKDGWVYGPVKDPSKKQHPCMVPYDQLPIEQRRKDALFKGIVGSLTKE